MKVVHKIHAEKLDGMSFVLSDQTPDRMGDIIMADGWETTNFKKNPIALFGHRSDFPLGSWKNLRVEKTRLVGDLTMAPEGTSARIDEVRRLVEADVLKAVSVGFRDIESVPIDIKNPWDGTRFIKSELVECSLVAIPANPNALAISKSLNISDDTFSLVFGSISKQSDHDLMKAVRSARKGDRVADQSLRKSARELIDARRPLPDILAAYVIDHLAFAEHGAGRQDDVGEHLRLSEPDKWSPYEAAKAKLWLAALAKQHPFNPMYRKMHRLMDEIETVRTVSLVSAEHGSKSRAS